MKFFTSRIKGKFTTEESAEEWFKSITDTLNNYKNFYEKENEKSYYTWQIFRLEIESLYFRLTELKRNEKFISAIDDYIGDTLKRIKGLPGEEKINFYNKSKKRLDYINKKLDEITEKMNEEDKLIFEESISSDKYKDIVRKPK